MVAPDTFEHCLKTLGVGCAIVDPANWHILFENALFFQWFPPEAADPDSLTTRIPDLNTERAEARFAKGRSQLIELDVQQGARKRSLQLELRREAANGGDFVVVECRDISKQMEAEYMLDSYSRMSEKHTRELQKEKDRVEKLLLNIMPRSVYEEMRDFGTSTPQRFDQASVLMLDFVGFTSMAVSRDPSALIAELNDIFSAFDRIAELFGCERIKTIGDAYVAVSGLPESTPDHAANIAKVALRMRRYLEKRNAAHPTHWTCRIGVATGPLIGSLVGIQKYVYDIFGPAVNLAARLEAVAEPMQIVLCSDTAADLNEEFEIDKLDPIEIKGFGEPDLYSLEREIRGRV